MNRGWHSHQTEAHAVLILQSVDERSQLHLREVPVTLQKYGAAVGLNGYHDFPAPRRKPKKETVHANEQSRADVKETR